MDKNNKPFDNTPAVLDADQRADLLIKEIANALFDKTGSAAGAREAAAAAVKIFIDSMPQSQVFKFYLDWSEVEAVIEELQPVR